MQVIQGKMAAYGIYPRSVELQSIVDKLNQAGFKNEDICLLLAPGHPIAMEVREMRSSRAVVPADALETLMGWLTRLGAVVISNLAFFVRSPDFLHALVEQRESAAGGHRGALTNLGIPECQAGRLGTRISNGGGLVYVDCARTAQSGPAVEIFQQTGAEETWRLR